MLKRMDHLPGRLERHLRYCLYCPSPTAGRMLSPGKEVVSESYLKERDATHAAPVFPLSFLTPMEDLVNQSQHPLLGKLTAALGASASSGSLSPAIIPGLEALPIIEGSQITTQLNGNCCYFHRSRALRGR